MLKYDSLPLKWLKVVDNSFFFIGVSTNWANVNVIGKYFYPSPLFLGRDESKLDSLRGMNLTVSKHQDAEKELVWTYESQPLKWL
jgi:hypothetical protein